MIVFLDTKTRNILLYKETGLIKIPFNKVNSIVNHIGNNKVLYITNAINVDSNDIVKLISKLGVNVNSFPIEEISKDKYLHVISESTIPINEDLIFRGKFDCKIMDTQMKKEIKKNRLLQKLLKKNILEIVGENRKNELYSELKDVQKKEIEIQQQKDDKLSSIIMDTKVSDLDGRIYSTGDDRSSITINLDDEPPERNL